MADSDMGTASISVSHKYKDLLRQQTEKLEELDEAVLEQRNRTSISSNQEGREDLPYCSDSSQSCRVTPLRHNSDSVNSACVIQDSDPGVDSRHIYDDSRSMGNDRDDYRTDKRGDNPKDYHNVAKQMSVNDLEIDTYFERNNRRGSQDRVCKSVGSSSVVSSMVSQGHSSGHSRPNSSSSSVSSGMSSASQRSGHGSGHGSGHRSGGSYDSSRQAPPVWGALTTARRRLSPHSSSSRSSSRTATPVSHDEPTHFSPSDHHHEADTSISNLKCILADKEIEIQRLVGQVDRLTGDNKSLVDELEDVKQRLKHHQQNQEISGEKYNRLLSEKEILATEVVKLRDELDAALNRGGDCLADFTNEDSGIGFSPNHPRVLQRKIDDLQCQIQDLHEANESAMQKLAESERRLLEASHAREQKSTDGSTKWVDGAAGPRRNGPGERQITDKPNNDGDHTRQLEEFEGPKCDIQAVRNRNFQLNAENEGLRTRHLDEQINPSQQHVSSIQGRTGGLPQSLAQPPHPSAQNNHPRNDQMSYLHHPYGPRPDPTLYDGSYPHISNRTYRLDVDKQTITPLNFNYSHSTPSSRSDAFSQSSRYASKSGYYQQYDSKSNIYTQSNHLSSACMSSSDRSSKPHWYSPESKKHDLSCSSSSREVSEHSKTFGKTSFSEGHSHEQRLSRSFDVPQSPHSNSFVTNHIGLSHNSLPSDLANPHRRDPRQHRRRHGSMDSDETTLLMSSLPPFRHPHPRDASNGSLIEDLIDSDSGVTSPDTPTDITDSLSEAGTDVLLSQPTKYLPPSGNHRRQLSASSVSSDHLTQSRQLTDPARLTRSQSHERILGSAGHRSVMPKPLPTQHNKPAPSTSSHPLSPSMRPYVPRTANELTTNDVVKFSRQGGKLSQGWVKYVGHLPGRHDVYVGVELDREEGKHDGVFEGARYFKCKPGKGVFVAFHKIIMAWCN